MPLGTALILPTALGTALFLPTALGSLIFSPFRSGGGTVAFSPCCSRHAPCGAAGLSADARGSSPARSDSRRVAERSPGTRRYLGLRSLAPPPNGNRRAPRRRPPSLGRRRPRALAANAPRLLDARAPSGVRLPGRSRKRPRSKKGDLGLWILWHPQRESNPCCRLERAMSWATRRWGPVADEVYQTRHASATWENA